MRDRVSRTEGVIHSGEMAIENFLLRRAQELRERGIQVDDKMRLDMEGYAGEENFPAAEVAADMAEVKQQNVAHYAEQRLEKPRLRGMTDTEIAKVVEGQDSIKFEKLKTALFGKFLGSDVIVCRASEFDDVLGGTDNIIFDTKTGKALCAVDELTDNELSFLNIPTDGAVGKMLAWLKSAVSSSPVLQEKSVKANSTNVKGGAFIKYGLAKPEKGDDPKLAHMNGVPKFLLTLSPDILRRALVLFKNEAPEKGTPDHRIFAILVCELLAQIKGIEENKDIKPAMKQKAAELKTFLESSL